jgi:hypothetical protein
MIDSEFFALVERMRKAQKQFFRQKDNLQECKGLETAVDEAIAARNAGPDLFSAPQKEQP